MLGNRCSTCDDRGPLEAHTALPFECNATAIATHGISCQIAHAAPCALARQSRTSSSSARVSLPSGIFEGAPSQEPKEQHVDEGRTLTATCTKSKKRGVSIDPRISGAYSAREVGLLAKGARWYNNWNVTSNDPTAFRRLAFMPMVWSRYGADHWMQAIKQTPLKGGAGSIILGFNEPNSHSQSNMTPQLAAAEWGAVLARAKQLRFKLASPSPTKKGYPAALLSGIEWLQQFFAEADRAYGTTNAGVHYINMHTYDCDVASVSDRIDCLSTAFDGLPIIVSEVGCAAAKLAGNATMMMDFMQQVVPMLEAHPRVAYYSWFNGLDKYAALPASSSLFSKKNKLSPLGLEYTKCVPRPATAHATPPPAVIVPHGPGATPASSAHASSDEPPESVPYERPLEVQCLLDRQC